MADTVKKNKLVVRKKRSKKAVPLTKAEMVQKMFADQKFIREAIHNCVSFKELREKHGYKFATV
jgi:ribosomal protein L31E